MKLLESRTFVDVFFFIFKKKNSVCILHSIVTFSIRNNEVNSSPHLLPNTNKNKTVCGLTGADNWGTEI